MWPIFLEVFNDEYFSKMVRDQKTMKFLNLKQGKMTVVEYNTKFMELCRYVKGISQGEEVQSWTTMEYTK